MSIDEFIALLANEISATPAEINADTRLNSIPRLDSMGRLSVMAMADEKFSVTLDAESFDRCATVADLHRFLVGGGK